MDDYKVFKEGAVAFVQGTLQKNNPYPKNGHDWRMWRRGWRAARTWKLMFQIVEEEEKSERYLPLS